MSAARLPVPGISIEQQPDDILAAMLVWGEARGESRLGRVAVAWVAKNRALSSGRPLRRVILQPWQFSSFNANDPNREKLLDPIAFSSHQSWDDCFHDAAAALAGIDPDPTGGATHYCTAALWGGPTPAGHRIQWYHLIEIEAGRTVETARIGHHVFGKAA
jgi:spore germination cell wall hydrolase CwlJ-like protein